MFSPSRMCCPQSQQQPEPRSSSIETSSCDLNLSSAISHGLLEGHNSIHRSPYEGMIVLCQLSEDLAGHASIILSYHASKLPQDSTRSYPCVMRGPVSFSEKALLFESLAVSVPVKVERV